jgi:hypothetical protein
MFEAATGLDTDRLSLPGCFRIVKRRLPECDGSTPGRLGKLKKDNSSLTMLLRFRMMGISEWMRISHEGFHGRLPQLRRKDMAFLGSPGQARQV